MGKSRNRPKREKKTRPRARSAESGPGAAGKTIHHPLFGDVPLVPASWSEPPVGNNPVFIFDPDYSPPLPAGAVRGDPRKQIFCTACHVPRYFYVDEDRHCVQCGSIFTFSGAEQKYWYETLRFNFESQAIRCLSCRRKRRTRRARQRQLMEAQAAVKDHPDDPAHLLGLAEAILRYFQLTGEGNLNQALAATRKARRFWPQSKEAVFLEGLAHALADREDKARAHFQELLASPKKKGRKGLAREAREWLEKLPVT